MNYVFSTIDWTVVRSFKSCVHILYSFDAAIGAKCEKKARSGNEKKSSVVWTCPML